MRHTPKADELMIIINFALQLIDDFKNTKTMVSANDQSSFDKRFTNSYNSLIAINLNEVKTEFWELSNELPYSNQIPSLYKLKFKSLLNWETDFTQTTANIASFILKELIPFHTAHTQNNIDLDLEVFKNIGINYCMLVNTLIFIKSEINLLINQHIVVTNKIPLESESYKLSEQTSIYKLAPKHKTEFITTLSSMFDARMFIDAEGKTVGNKQKFMESIGSFLNDDFSDFRSVESHSTHQPALAGKKNKTDQPDFKEFSLYLLHKDQHGLAAAIKKEFSTEKSKKMRLLLEAMQDMNPPLITISRGDCKRLYHSMENHFDHKIGSYNSIFDSEYEKSNLQSEIDSYKIRLNFILENMAMSND